MPPAPIENDSRSRTGLSLVGLMEAGLGLGLVGCWIGWFRGLHWFPALFDHFRVQGVLVCVVLLVIYAVRRRWRWFAVAGITLAISAWPLVRLSRNLPTSVAADAHPELNLISFNVLTSNPHKSEVLKYLQSAGADVIMLLEVDPAWIKALKPLRETHPHGIDAPEYHNFGLAFYSRVPLKSCEVVNFYKAEIGSIVAVLQHEGREIQLIGTHPMPPTNSELREASREQLLAIARRVADQTALPSVVVGDFNVSPWSVEMNLLRENSSLDFRTPGPAWLPTWKARHLLALPIDHALCTPPLFFPTRTIGPDLGSDHRPQELKLKWSRESGAGA